MYDYLYLALNHLQPPGGSAVLGNTWTELQDRLGASGSPRAAAGELVSVAGSGGGADGEGVGTTIDELGLGPEHSWYWWLYRREELLGLDLDGAHAAYVYCKLRFAHFRLSC